MGDFDCCGRDHDVPDPTSVALARQLTRVRELTWALSDAESKISRMEADLREWELVGAPRWIADREAKIAEALADGWDEGAKAAREEDFMAEDFVETSNPYRKES